MNLAKSKVVLKKINTLHDNILLSGKVSRIEKDLFLDYLRDLYAVVLEEAQVVMETPLMVKENIVVKNPEPELTTKSEPYQDRIPEQEVKKSEPKIEKVKEKVVIPEPQYEMVEVSQSDYNTNGHIIEKTRPEQVDLPKKETKKVNPAIASLFNDESIDQQAYRFSHSPITDISKAMGINEKILTVNQLFNKDQQEFNYVATKLNYFNTFDEACEYLRTEVATKYDWSSDKNRSKAIDFIRLVRRKYTS